MVQSKSGPLQSCACQVGSKSRNNHDIVFTDVDFSSAKLLRIDFTLT